MTKISEAREIKNLRKNLRSLTTQVMATIERVDRIMKQPDSNLRGKQIAEAMNALEMSNDGARYFGLGINFRTDKKPARAALASPGRGS